MKNKKTLHDHLIVIQNLLFIGMIIMLSAILFQGTTFSLIPFILGLLLMISSVFYSAKYFRCPHCGTKLDPRIKAPNYCPHCGKKLQ